MKKRTWVSDNIRHLKVQAGGLAKKRLFDRLNMRNGYHRSFFGNCSGGVLGAFPVRKEWLVADAAFIHVG